MFSTKDNYSIYLLIHKQPTKMWSVALSFTLYFCSNYLLPVAKATDYLQNNFFRQMWSNAIFFSFL